MVERAITWLITMAILLLLHKDEHKSSDEDLNSMTHQFCCNFNNTSMDMKSSKGIHHVYSFNI